MKLNRVITMSAILTATLASCSQPSATTPNTLLANTPPPNATSAPVTTQTSLPSPTVVAQPTSTTVPTALAADKPVGIIALGHSGLTGYGTDPKKPNRDAKTNSWATGTNPEINSIYQRLLAVHPETAEHVANTAQGGAQAITLIDQTRLALDQVPAPELVVIQTFDNDIRCDGSDPENLKTFGHFVEIALNEIVKTSPKSHILLMSQPGRPATFAEALQNNPVAKKAFTGTGMCDLFDPDGKINQEHVATLTKIIESYEAEQARVCAQVPQCTTDHGAATTFVDDINQLVPDDWGHLTVQGQARVAERIWPVVSELLELK